MCDCPKCGRSLEYYEHEILANPEEVGESLLIKYWGWCPACEVNYDWFEEYTLKQSFGLRKGN